MTTTDRDTEVLPRVTDLPAALAAAAPRRWWNRATPILAGATLVACAFLGGVAVQKQWGQAGASTASAAPERNEGAPGGPPSGFPAGRGETTTGTLTTVTTDSLTMRTEAGTTVTVRIVGSTEVRLAATLAELRTGRPVTVRGTAATDGTVTATAVTGS